MSKNNLTNTILDKVPSDVKKRVIELFNNVKKDSEFELSFYNFGNKYLSLEKYKNFMLFLKKRYSNVETENTLDLNYTDNEKTYRITLNENINDTLKSFYKYNNYVTLKTLIKKSKTDKDEFVM